jgi:hypothetical protein
LPTCGPGRLPERRTDTVSIHADPAAPPSAALPLNDLGRVEVRLSALEKPIGSALYFTLS